LIEAATGHHVWADKFDGALEDLFELQDQITEAVAGALEPSIQKAEIARSENKPTENLDAYDLYLRAFALLWGMTREKSALALELLERAYEIDASFALARALSAHVHIIRKGQVWSEPGDIQKGTNLLWRLRRMPLMIRWSFAPLVKPSPTLARISTMGSLSLAEP
jgi:adenylate cyclase